MSVLVITPLEVVKGVKDELVQSAQVGVLLPPEVRHWPEVPIAVSSNESASEYTTAPAEAVMF
jgi:hypothetical protein